MHYAYHKHIILIYIISHIRCEKMLAVWPDRWDIAAKKYYILDVRDEPDFLGFSRPVRMEFMVVTGITSMIEHLKTLMRVVFLYLLACTLVFSSMFFMVRII